MAKILCITNSSELAGTEKVVLLGLKALKARGHKAHLLSLHPLGALAPLLRAESISCQGLAYGRPFGLGDLGAILRAARAWEPDAIWQVGHNVAAAWAIRSLCPGHRVLSCHFHHEPPAWRWRLIYGQAVRTYDCVTFVNAFARDQALLLAPVLGDHSLVLNNPYELPKLLTRSERLRSRRAMALPPDARVVGNAGQLIHRKRWDVFLRVLKLLQRKRPTWAVIAGDGPQAAELKAMARHGGLTDKIRWLGQRSDMRTVYASMDVLLFNSDVDVLGNTPIEAVTLGLPAVCSVERGGLAGFFGAVKGLEVLGSHDEEALAARCERFLKYTRQSGECIRNLRHIIRRDCAPSRFAANLENLLGLAG